KNPITKENIETCKKHLDKQLEIIQPELILSLGQLTLSSLRKTFTDINSNHGQIFYYNDIPSFPTFHPMDVLSNPLLKKNVWEDLKKIQEFFKKNL
ncbi:MAG: uracil-DNA glycosylase, partial [Spirochaetes bacterium]|nr:uracil-DNA glycosylase [Spirochaetota bacterium]